MFDTQNTEFNTAQWVGHLHPYLAKRMQGKPKIYRITREESRFYFTKADEHSPVKIYNNGTNAISNYRDKNKEEALRKWWMRLVNDGINPKKYVQERADYGSIMHVGYGRIGMGETVEYGKPLRNFLIEGSHEARLNPEYAESLVLRNFKELSKDMASFSQFLIDFKVKPLGVEVVLKSDKYCVATPLDFICWMTIKIKGFWGEVYKSGARKGQPKETYKEEEVLAILDFKSGKKGFFDVHALQLIQSKRIFMENFPDLPEPMIFNFAPNDWKGDTPTYKLYNQERDNNKINYLNRIATNVFERGLADFREELKTRGEKRLVGTIDPYGEQQNTGVMKRFSLEEIANEYWIEKYVEESKKEAERIEKKEKSKLEKEAKKKKRRPRKFSTQKLDQICVGLEDNHGVRVNVEESGENGYNLEFYFTISEEGEGTDILDSLLKDLRKPLLVKYDEVNSTIEDSGLDSRYCSIKFKKK